MPYHIVLTAPTEADLIAALPEYRVQSEDGEHWASQVIAPCTRWITRPQYDEDGNLTNTPETVPGFTLILYADSAPAEAAQYVVADPGDIEPVPAGGLKKPAVPQVVSALQGMRAIKQAGLVEAFLNWKASLDPIEDFEDLAFFDKAQTWEYDNRTLDRGLTALGMSDQKDALFTLAATL